MSLWGGIASAVGSVVGAGASLLGSSAQARAAEQAGDRSYAMYKQQRKDLLPQIQLGQQSTNALRDIYLTGERDFTAAPGYDFRVQEGQKALDRSGAARGLQRSGPQMKAALRYGQNIATDEYNQGFNRLASMAGIGNAGVGQANQAGNVYVNNANQAGTNAAAARASGYSGVGSSINSGINNMLTLRALQGLY